MAEQDGLCRRSIGDRYLTWGDLLEANNGVAKSNGGDVGGTWLQLMCCTLPKHLCP